MTRIAILASHPVQYYAPLFRALAQISDLTVFYAHQATPEDQANEGFGVAFSWDVDLLSGYEHLFLTNSARIPGLNRFWGVDTPEIGQRLREKPFDALLLMGWHYKSFIQGLIAAKQLGIPVLVRGDSHLETPRSLLKVVGKRLLYPFFLRRFDGALIVGKRNRAYWEHYGYPSERMFDAPHCVDNAFFACHATPEARSELRDRLMIAPNTKLILMANKLIPIKRPFDLVNAVALARKEGLDAHVLVAGSGTLETDLRKYSSELGVPVHLLGFCNQTQMPAAYAAADLLVMCSESETWGLVVNEALASSTPVLISDTVGCAPDLTQLLGSDVIFQKGQIQDLAAKLKKILLNPPTHASIDTASNRFAVEAVANQIMLATKALEIQRDEKNKL